MIRLDRRSDETELHGGGSGLAMGCEHLSRLRDRNANADDRASRMTTNRDVVHTYLEGFRTNDHEQILSCLTGDVEWTVFGAFHLTGKDDYAAAIEGPGFVGPPDLEVIRMVEEGDVVMAELTGRVPREDGGVSRLSMAEVFVMRAGKISERRAWVITLEENGYR